MIDAALVDIWSCDVDQLGEAAALQFLLDAVERQRNERFLLARPRQLHAAAHGLARLAIASRLDVQPSRLRFGRAASGKPFLIEPTSTITFNLAHGGSLAVCAVADGHQVGVDVEPVDRPELTRKLLDGLLAAGEHERLDGLEGEALQEALVALWTGKEAIAKAHGAGLSLPLAEFVVPPGDGGVAMSRVPGTTPPLWRLHRLQPDRRHRVALAVALSPSAPLRVRVRDVTSILRDLQVPERTAGSA